MRPRPTLRLCAFLILAFALAGTARADGLLLIANVSVIAPTPLTMEQISSIYLLRSSSWPDGSHIVPVNREASSDLRAHFTQAVLHQDTSALAAYWNKMHFLGKDPPVVQESEQSMLAFVQRVPGAIGYISAATAPDNVKVLRYVP